MRRYSNAQICKALREAMNFTITQMANELKISPKQYSHFEKTGYVKFEELFRLAIERLAISYVYKGFPLPQEISDELASILTYCKTSHVIEKPHATAHRQKSRF